NRGGEPTMACWTADTAGIAGPIAFEDVTDSAGLVEPLTGMHGHAAVWTDVNGDDRPDLYVGTFADSDAEEYAFRGATGASPDRLLVSDGSKFTVDESLPEAFTRTSGGATADLDGDGDLDMVVSRNRDEDELELTSSQVLENQGGSLVPAGDLSLPEVFGGRSVGVLDYDRDGLYDLFIAEDHWVNGSSRLLHNDGGLSFSDATAEAGIPDDVHGLGVATADFDGDGLSDIFVSGSNRLLLSDGPGRFSEADNSVFAWESYGDEDDVAGVSVADVNRDGLLDIAIGHHYNSTLEFGTEVAVRLYLNRGDGLFEDVTEQAGLVPIPTKAPHVELNDFDNDGWPDLLASAAAGDGPALFVNEGVEDGVPRFAAPDGFGSPQYWVAAPSTDYDRDGRLDVFMVEWYPSLPSILLRNETPSGHWLEISVDADHGYGIGWRVEVRDGDELIGAREIAVTQGYSAGVLPVAHFGLGTLDEVDVRLVPSDGSGAIDLTDVTANQHLRWPNGCG
ncbi:MAG: CRTAC1 family protein, partial [Acidimicrobiia bacterium]